MSGVEVTKLFKMNRSQSILNLFRKNLFKGRLFIKLASMIACANPISPTGGPIDEQAPRIDTLKSTPNYQTNFDQRSFELTFDEWVVLEDVLQQVVVSPPLDFEVTLKKRTVTFEVKAGDSLRANTTYTVNFGEAVKDLTEKNPAEDLRFVFSTGPFLDSLSISGRLLDVVERTPVEGAYFMLYDNLADSVVRTQRPYYFGRTNKQGFFEINNLRAGTYKGFALKNSGASSYFYNNVGAQIGFPDSLIVVNADTQPTINHHLFIEDKPLRFFNSDATTYGQVKMVFNQTPPVDLQITIPDSVNLNFIETEVDKDTFRLWYDKTDNTSWRFKIQKDTLVEDTITVRGLSIDDFLANARLQQVTNRGTASVKPGDPIEIRWNHPLNSIDSNYIFLFKDSLLLRPGKIEIDSIDFKLLRISYPFQQDSVYQLILDPGAIRDQYGLTNDSTDVRLAVGNVEDYGTIILNFTNLDSTGTYLGELLQGNNLTDTFYIKNQAVFNYEKRLLRPGNYSLRLIVDRNNNQKWDTGSYAEKRQAELIYTKKLEQLRANWELEVDINLNELSQAPPVQEAPTNSPSNRSSNSRN